MSLVSSPLWFDLKYDYLLEEILHNRQIGDWQPKTTENDLRCWKNRVCINIVLTDMWCDAMVIVTGPYHSLTIKVYFSIYLPGWAKSRLDKWPCLVCSLMFQQATKKWTFFLLSSNRGSGFWKSFTPAKAFRRSECTERSRPNASQDLGPLFWEFVRERNTFWVALCAWLERCQLPPVPSRLRLSLGLQEERKQKEGIRLAAPNGSMGKNVDSAARALGRGTATCDTSTSQHVTNSVGFSPPPRYYHNLSCQLEKKNN